MNASVVTTMMGTAGAWLWEQWGKDIVKKALDTTTENARELIKRKWEQVKWCEASKRYRDRITELYSTIRVLGNPKPVSLESVFTDLFILDEPAAYRRFDVESLRSDSNAPARSERINGVRLITRPDASRLFILGKPGSGKTTFLKYLTLKAAEGKLDKIPIFVSLREWSNSTLELGPFIARQFEICGFPDATPFIDYILEKGRVIMLFDGLDEVNRQGGQRDKTIHAIRDCCRQYLQNQFIITCRVAAIDYRFEQFSYVEVADFTPAQVRVYAHRWFDGNPTKRDLFLEDISQEENRGLRELARTPLLLSMLCLAFDETMRFPMRKSDIYRDALDALLRRWDSERNIRRDGIYRKLSNERKLHMFARIAAETFEKAEYALRQGQLEQRIVDYLHNLPPADLGDQEIDGRAVLKAIEAQHSIFVEQAYRVYTFSHLTFQEYFTAKYIVDNVAKGTLRRLVHDHLTSDRWSPIFLLVASMLDDASPLFVLLGRATSELLQDVQIIADMLTWIDQDVSDRFDLRPSLARVHCLVTVLCSSLTRELGYVLDHARTLDRLYALEFDLAITNALPTTSRLAGTLDFARSVASCLGVALDFAQADDVIVAFVSELVLKLNQNHRRARDFERAFTHHSDIMTIHALRRAGRFASRAYYGLAEDLEVINEIVQDLAFEQHLDLDRVHNVVREWNPSVGQITQLSTYLKANQLFAACLERAYVSNRAEVESSLLRLSF